MKKIILLLMPLLILCILCSCASHAGDTEHTDPANPSNLPAQGNSFLPEPCDCVEIYSDGTVSLRLFYGVHYETGKRTMILQYENTGEETVYAKIATPVINGVYAADNWQNGLNPGETDTFRVDIYKESLYYAGESVIRSISGKVQISSEGSGEPYAEKEFQAVFENEGRGFLWDWAENDQIPAQVLLDNDRCRLTLLCMGWDKLYHSDIYYSGILYAENKTDAELPVKINGLTVNGRAVEITSKQTSIPPENAAYISFDCLKSDLEEQRITGVNSVSLLIMTDQEENTGTRFFQNGGGWYPLKIENPDPVTETTVEEGTVLMDMNGVRIRLLEPTPQKVEYYGDEIHYVWKLYTENDTEENIEIGLVECIANDKAFDISDFEQPHLNCSGIAPGCSQFFEMKSGKYPLNTACPEISGVFRVYEYGKSRILFDSERVTFPNEGEIHDSVGE